MSEEDEQEGYTLKEIRTLIKDRPEMINACSGNRNRMTPLMTEVYNGNYRTVTLLLECESLIKSVRNAEGHSAFFYCLNPRKHVSEKFKLKCLKLLLRAGVQNVYGAHESYNFTPLMIAAKICDDVCLAEIIKVGYSNNVSTGIENVANDCEINTDEEFDYFQFSDYNHNAENDEVDGNGKLEHHIDIEKRLIDIYTYLDVYKKDCKKSIDFWDFKGRKTAFEHCLEAREVPVEKQLACVKLLVEAGATYRTQFDKWRPIALSISKYSAVDTSIIKYLISIGCCLKQADFENAVCYMHLEIAQLLIKEGIDPHFSTQNNQNILHTFFMWDNLDYFENDEVYGKLKKMLRFLVQELKFDINAVDDCGVSIFSLVFIYFIQEITFPFLYLISENMDCNILSNNNEMQEYHKRFRSARVFALFFKDVDHYKLLYDIGIPYDLNCKLHDRFLGRNEPNTNTIEWLDEISSNPDSLLRRCKFTVRKLLGRDIKSNISQVHLPKALKDMLLLKDVLPVECFE